MAKRKANPELIDEDNPEWTTEDFARARLGSEVLSASLLKKLRGPQKTPTKERITIRLSQDVVTRFRASGTGWQGRVDAVLREWLKRLPDPSKARRKISRPV
jgi:uncharacterized protein (DUF4415 family)